MIRVTVDTNRINATQCLPGMNILERWVTERKILLLASTTLMRETENHEGRRSKAEQMKYVAEPMVWGVSRWDETHWSQADIPEFRTIAGVMFPDQELDENKRRDVMLVLAHADVGADYLVTNNSKDFLKNGRREALESLGIVVMTDNELVKHLRQCHGWE